MAQGHANDKYTWSRMSEIWDSNESPNPGWESKQQKRNVPTVYMHRAESILENEAYELSETKIQKYQPF